MILVWASVAVVSIIWFLAGWYAMQARLRREVSDFTFGTMRVVNNAPEGTLPMVPLLDAIKMVHAVTDNACGPPGRRRPPGNPWPTDKT